MKFITALLKYLSPTEREGLENLISLTLVLLAFLYLTMFLGDLYLFLRGQITRTFPEITFFDFILRYGAILIVPTLYARALIFAQDSFASGRNRYAEFFRRSFPSRLLARGLSCSPEAADELWFRVFNAWQEPHHPRHTQWVATFRRTYSCRFIYYLQRWLLWAALLFAVTIVLESVYRYAWKGEWKIDEMLFARLLVVAGTCHIALDPLPAS